MDGLKLLYDHLSCDLKDKLCKMALKVCRSLYLTPTPVFFTLLYENPQNLSNQWAIETTALS